MNAGWHDGETARNRLRRVGKLVQPSTWHGMHIIVRGGCRRPWGSAAHSTVTTPLRWAQVGPMKPPGDAPPSPTATPAVAWPIPGIEPWRKASLHPQERMLNLGPNGRLPSLLHRCHSQAPVAFADLASWPPATPRPLPGIPHLPTPASPFRAAAGAPPSRHGRHHSRL